MSKRVCNKENHQKQAARWCPVCRAMVSPAMLNDGPVRCLKCHLLGMPKQKRFGKGVDGIAYELDAEEDERRRAEKRATLLATLDRSGLVGV